MIKFHKVNWTYETKKITYTEKNMWSNFAAGKKILPNLIYNYNKIIINTQDAITHTKEKKSIFSIILFHFKQQIITPPPFLPFFNNNILYCQEEVLQVN